MSSSDSDGIYHEKHEYPACEEDDCYCKRHWPSRSGGEEHKVVDNNTCGEITIRCDVAIDSNTDVNNCAFCERYMIGKGLRFTEEIEYCVRCCKYLPEFFLKYFDNCKFLETFTDQERLFIEDRVKEGLPIEKPLCSLCKKEHIELSEEDREFIYGYCGWVSVCDNEILIKSISNIITYLETRKSNEKNKSSYDTLQDFCNKFYDYINQKKKEKSNAKIELKKKIEEEEKKRQYPFISSGKRLLRNFIPNFSHLDEEEVERVIPAKFVRSCNEDILKQIECLADKMQNEMTKEDVMKFVEWLKQ